MTSGAMQLDPDAPSSDTVSTRYAITPSNYAGRAVTRNEATSPQLLGLTSMGYLLSRLVRRPTTQPTTPTCLHYTASPRLLIKQ